MDIKFLRDLRESYGSIYEESQEEDEHEIRGGIDPWKMSYSHRQKMLKDKLKKKNINKEEIENWVDSLIDEGYDLSEYTWEEIYEAYIEEAPQGDIGARIGRGLAGALRDLPSGVMGQVTGRDNAALQRQRQRSDNLRTLITTGKLPGANQGTAKTLPTTRPQPQKPLVDKSGRNVFDGTPSRPPSAPSGTRPKIGSLPPSARQVTQYPQGVSTGVGGGNSGASRQQPTSRPTAPAPSGAKVAPTAAAKPAAPAGQTGDKAKDMDTWAKANPKLAAAKAERDRTRGTSATTNPLMQGMKSRMSAPSSPSPTTASTAFSKSTPTLIKPMSNSPDYSAAKVSPSANVTGKKDQKSLASSFEWGSTSKLVDDIASLYQSVYEAKKVDQDQDGDNDFADVRIARLIASGVSKEEAIRRVKGKSYNEEYELDEENMKKSQRNAEKTKQKAKERKDRRTRIDYYGKKAVGFGSGDYLKPTQNEETELDEATRMRKELEQWVQELINEGYDLSDYTWDEMYEIYEETEEERKRNERRARVAELHASGRVMTSSKRASQKAAQRKQEKKEEMADRVLRSIQSSGRTRSSSTPMGSESPKPKEDAPKANRKLGSSVKKDTLASRADELLRMLQNEDYQLWVKELLDEGYELDKWSDEELVDLYVEIYG